MKLRKIILMAAIAFASVFALASSPYAYYRTSCGKTVIGHEQSPDDMSTYTIKTVGSITLPW